MMKIYSAVIERCPQNSLFFGLIPSFARNHSRAEILDKMNRAQPEVIAMFLGDGELAVLPGFR
jgi:hypothetical protein